jgi:anti-sigma B factor antagonist
MNEAVILRENNKATIQPPGDIVAASVPNLRAAVRGVVGEGYKELVVDLSKVRMVDSSGLGLLISAHNSLSKVGGHLQVIRATEDILSLFRTMRIQQHFNVSGE